MKRQDWAVVALAAACVAISGCGPATAVNPQNTESVPSKVQPVAGTNTKRVILTTQAAGQIGIKTDLVRKAPAATTGTGQNITVPTAAIVYQSDGTVWVYATLPPTAADSSSGALTFLRQPVVILKIDGDVAVLQSGPPVGTPVVTVGAAELLGTESGVEGGG